MGPTEELPISFALQPTRGRGLVLGIAGDGDHVVAVGGQGRDLFLSSTDGGHSFSPRSSPGNGLRDAYVDGDTVWVCGEWGYVARSNDRGRNWRPLPRAGGACLFGILADDDGTIWTAGDDGYLARLTWGTSFEEVEAVPHSIARLSNSPLGILIPTDDPGRLYVAAGDDVIRLNLEAGCDLMKARYTPAGSLIVVGAQGSVFRSTDDGDSFDRVSGAFSGLLCGLDVLPSGDVVIVGESGQVHVSHDDGQTFRQIRQGLATQYLWCCERVHDTLLAGTHDGALLRIGTSSREPTSLPPLPSEGAAEPARPAWRAPAPSTAVQRWEPHPYPEVVRQNGLFVTGRFRHALMPRRGGLDRNVRPLPTADEAWAAYRRAIWANDRKRMEEVDSRSEIWGLATSFDAAERAIGARLRRAERRPLTIDDAQSLVDATFSVARSIGRPRTMSQTTQIRYAACERLVDLLSCELGLAEAIGVLLDELSPDRTTEAICVAERLRDILSVVDDGSFAPARAAILKAVGARADDEAGRFLGWLGTFLLPPGPAGGAAEERLHAEMLDTLVELPNSRIQICGLASGGVDTLRRYLEANGDEVPHQLMGPFTSRLYVLSVLERDGREAAELFARLRPTDRYGDEPSIAALWLTLMSLIDSDVARRALLDAYRHPDLREQGLAGLRESAKLDRRAMSAFLRREGAEDVLDEVEQGLRAPLGEVPAEPDEALLFQGLDEPIPYQAPEAVDVPLATPEWAPVMEIESESTAEPPDRALEWNGTPIADCSATERTAFVEHVESWEIPLGPADLASVPPAVHERLLAVGVDPNCDSWTQLPAVLRAAPRTLMPLADHALRAAKPGFGRSRDEGGAAGFELIDRVADVRLVGAMAEVFVTTRARPRAAAWLRRHPRHAAAGAIGLFAEAPDASSTRRLLRFLQSEGHRELVMEYAAHVDPDAVRNVLDADPLTPEVRAELALPEWSDPARHPALVSVDGASATPSEMKKVRAWLAFCNELEPHPYLTGANDRWRADSIQALALSLFEAWRTEGPDAEHRWALHALGYLGAANASEHIWRAAEEWSTGGHPQLAEEATFALYNLGTGAAGMRLALLAERSPSAMVRDSAAFQLRQVAERDGHSVDQLVDQWSDAVAPELASTLHSARLERMMITQQRIRADRFRRHYVEEGGIARFARGLLWRVADEPSTTFRVAEDATLADADDGRWALPADADVCVAHPLHLDAEQLRRWTEVFSDYEIAQPFPQLSRTIFLPGERELETFTDSARVHWSIDFRPKTVTPARFRDLLVAGWRPSDYRDGALVLDLDDDVQAVLHHSPEWWFDQPLEDVSSFHIDELVLHASSDRDGFVSKPSIAFSEMLYSVERVGD